MAIKVRSDEIKHALSIRHHDDSFFTEVKNGPTHTASELLIMDAVAVAKSWAHPCITGYEIKVARQDFMRDEKWYGYLDYCNKFSFVCPKGLILPEELPDHVGLIYYNPEKKCLTMKKKPVMREIDIKKVYDMLYYLVICKLDNERHPFFKNTAEKMIAWIDNKKQTYTSGLMVTSKMLEELGNLREQLATSNRKLEWDTNARKELDSIKTILRDAGINTNSYRLEDELKQALAQGTPPMLEKAVLQIKNNADILINMLSKPKEV
jgi:hypothetical protein